MTGRTQQVDALVDKLLLSEGVARNPTWNTSRTRCCSAAAQADAAPYRDVIKGRRVEDQGSRRPRTSSSIGAGQGGRRRLACANRIYERVFDAAWVKQNMPVNWAGIMAAVAVVALGACWVTVILTAHSEIPTKWTYDLPAKACPGRR